MNLLIVAKKKPTGGTFGERLRSARENAGMTQAELADAAGVHRVNLSQYERDQVSPSFEVACKLADALDVSLDDLRGGGSAD